MLSWCKQNSSNKKTHGHLKTTEWFLYNPFSLNHLSTESSFYSTQILFQVYSNKLGLRLSNLTDWICLYLGDAASHIKRCILPFHGYQRILQTVFFHSRYYPLNRKLAVIKVYKWEKSNCPCVPSTSFLHLNHEKACLFTPPFLVISTVDSAAQKCNPVPAGLWTFL